MKYRYRMHHARAMDNNNNYYVLFVSVLSLALGMMLARPKRVPEAVFALLAGMFSGLVIAPMIAELFTNIANSYQSLAWLKATPDTSFYAGIVGICFLLGFQIVLFFKKDFLEMLKRMANKRLKIEDKNGNSRNSGDG